MVALYFILFEISIQLELIYKIYFIFNRNGFENEVEKAKFDFDDGQCPSSSSSIVHPNPNRQQNLGRQYFKSNASIVQFLINVVHLIE